MSFSSPFCGFHRFVVTDIGRRPANMYPESPCTECGMVQNSRKRLRDIPLAILSPFCPNSAVRGIVVQNEELSAGAQKEPLYPKEYRQTVPHLTRSKSLL
jgi:hypothetical protein